MSAESYGAGLLEEVHKESLASVSQHRVHHSLFGRSKEFTSNTPTRTAPRPSSDHAKTVQKMLDMGSW